MSSNQNQGANNAQNPGNNAQNPGANNANQNAPAEPGLFTRAYSAVANEAIDLGQQAAEHKKLTACSFAAGCLSTAAYYWLRK